MVVLSLPRAVQDPVIRLLRSAAQCTLGCMRISTDESMLQWRLAPQALLLEVMPVAAMQRLQLRVRCQALQRQWACTTRAQSRPPLSLPH